MYAETLEAKREEIFARMMETLTLTNPPQDPLPGGPEEVRQFVAGFLHVAIEAAKGNTTPMQDYVSLVVPSIKQSGMALSVVMAGMVQVAFGGSVALEGETRLEWMRFCVDYTRRLCVSWDAA